MADNAFKKYRNRLAREGFVKALLSGAIIGFSLLAVCAAVSWLCAFKEGLWVSLALFALGLGVGTFVFYRFKYRPTTKAIAKRVDALGLEERVLTMTELENDDSYIAMKQREDTKKALSLVGDAALRIAVSVSLIVAVVCVGIAGVGFATVETLYYAGVIPSGISALVKETQPSDYTVTYKVASGNGAIVYWMEDWTAPEEVVWSSAWTDANAEEKANAVIHVSEGNSVRPVLAVASNSIFVGWSDGLTDPYRHDVDVTKDMEIYAYFVSSDEVADLVDDQQSGDDGDGSQGDANENLPPQESGSGSNPSDNSPGSNNNDGTGSSHDNSSDQILDGNTYYGDQYDGAHSDAMNELGSNNDMGDDLKGGISDYFDSIQKGGSDDSGDGGDGEGSEGGD